MKKDWVSGTIHGDNSVLRDLLCCQHGESRWCSGYHAWLETRRIKCVRVPVGADCVQSPFFLLSSSSRGKTSRKPASGNLGKEKQEKLASLVYRFSCFSMPRFPRAGFRDVFPRLDELKRKIGTARSLQSGHSTNFFGRVRRKWNRKKMPIYLEILCFDSFSLNVQL